MNKITAAVEILFLSMVLLIVRDIRAGNTESPQEIDLSLMRTVELAIQNNFGLEQTQYQLAVAELEVDRDRSNFLPEVSASTGLSGRWGKTKDAETGDYEGDVTSSARLGLSASVNLFNGFSDTATLRQSELELQSAEHDLKRQIESVIFNAVLGYFNVITAEKLVTVEEENLKAQQQQLEQVTAYYDAGMRPVTDVFQLKAEIAAAEYRLTATRKDLEINRLQMIEILGTDAATEYRFADPCIEPDDFGNLKPDISEIVRKAATERQDLLAQKYRIAAAGQQLTIARSDKWPSVSMSLDAGTSYSRSNQIDTAFSEQVKDVNPYASLGVSVGFPLFDRHRTKYGEAIAKRNLQVAESQRKQLEQKIEIEIRSAWQELLTALKQLDKTEALVDSTLNALNSYRERYNVNAATYVELSQARAQHLSAAYDRISARNMLMVKGFTMAYYQGNLKDMLIRLSVDRRVDDSGRDAGGLEK
ncbi:TolC family protein [bacterium]|nr:TolC family protein [candidate division CSSED10-310 bacterium]